MQKVKIRPADFPMTTSKNRIDLPVVLSLAGIVSVAAVIGAAAFQSGIVSDGTRYIASLVSSTGASKTTENGNLSKEISRLSRKLAKVSMQLERVLKTQATTQGRVDEIEEAFVATAAIPATAALRSSPYYRILETGWNADDMVTRKQKRDRTARLRSELIAPKEGQFPLDKTPAKTQYAVELNSFENIITARNSWRKLSEIYGPLLNNLEPHLLPTLGGKNQKARVKLIAGPVETATKAAQICSALRSNGQACQERLFSKSNIRVVSAPANSAVKLTEKFIP